MLGKNISKHGVVSTVQALFTRVHNILLILLTLVITNKYGPLARNWDRGAYPQYHKQKVNFYQFTHNF